MFGITIGSVSLAACFPTSASAPATEIVIPTKTPDLAEIPQLPVIEPLTRGDVEVFLKNCVDCEPLGIVEKAVDGAYLNQQGHFLFHAVDKNGADYFYINQNTGNGFEPLDWMDLGENSYALISKIEAVTENPKFYFTWNTNQNLGQQNNEGTTNEFIVTYQPDGTINSATNYSVPVDNNIHTILKNAKINRPTEATATPEPTVIQKEVVFPLTNGETITMNATLPNIPNEAQDAEINKILSETVKAMFLSMLDEGLAFGDLNAPRGTDGVPKEKLDFWKKLSLIPDVGNKRPGFIYPDSQSVSPQDKIFLGVWGIANPEGNGLGTLVKYKTSTSTMNYRYLGINVDKLLEILSSDRTLLPDNPNP